MTDELVARVRSPYALTESDAQEIADALEARGKRIDEMESRLVDKEVRIAELEATLKFYADARNYDAVTNEYGDVYEGIGERDNWGDRARAALKGEK